MLEVMFCAECIGPINSISWQYHVPRHHGMNFVCKSGFIELKKKKRQHLKSLYFCNNDALSCCCRVFVGRVREGCSPKFCSLPCLCLCVLSKICDVNSKLNYRRIVVIQWGPFSIFSLQMESDFFSPHVLGFCL